MRAVITGATGIVGRHLMFELIKRHADDLDALDLVILGRAGGGRSLGARVRKILLEDGLPYVANGLHEAPDLAEYADAGVRCIDTDLNQDGLGLSAEGVRALSGAPIDLLIHAAAVTDLRDSRTAELAVEETNVRGTRRLLKLLAGLDVRELSYIGSAYCCGEASGLVGPDYVSSGHSFRNPYEASKMQAEVEVRRFADRSGVRCRYFRPSIVSGRLIEPPLGSISNFNVFYGLGVFLLRTKMAMLPDGADILRDPLELDLRACCTGDCGLNIVPADFVAKAICEVCLSHDEGESYHIVNAGDTPTTLLVPLLMESLNIHGFRLVDHVPTDQNRIEQLFYKTVGAYLTPYARPHDVTFDTSSLAPVLERAGLECPPVDAGNFRILMQYAKEQCFGVCEEC
jgi:nucleoside-diphosphate-sugar epimerase